MVRRCASHYDNAEVARMHRLIRATPDDGSLLYLDVQYHFLVETQSQVPSMELIRAQHQILNEAMNKANWGLAKIPTTGKYAFQDRVGDARTLFMPTDPAELLKSHLNVVIVAPGEINESSPLASVLQVQEPFHGVMNIYYTKIPGGILGQAKVGSNYCVVEIDTCGSERTPNPDGGKYAYGITTVHEVGHALSLPHTFQGCGKGSFADIPDQKTPNSYAVLFEGGNGWDGRDENRSMDCIKYNDGGNPPYYSEEYNANMAMSCFDCNTLSVSQCTSCAVDHYEMFMNFMDYATDQSSVMFSNDQCTAMRKWLFGSGNSYLNIKDGDGSYIKTIPPPESGDTYSTTTLILFVILAVVVIASIALAVYYSTKPPGKR